MILAFFLLTELSSFGLGEYRDPMTDERQVILAAESGGSRLGIACKPGERMRAIFMSARSLKRPFFGTQLVYQLRIDEMPVERSIWTYEDSRTATLTGDFQIAALLDHIQSGNVLRFRATAYDGRFIDLAFDVSDARSMVENLMSQCRSDNVRREIAQRHRYRAKISFDMNE